MQRTAITVIAPCSQLPYHKVYTSCATQDCAAMLHQTDLFPAGSTVSQIHLPFTSDPNKGHVQIINV